MLNDSERYPANFISTIIAGDQASGKHGGRVKTRFPPEPNGFLHIGHAKAICLNFGLAKDFMGTTNLRFDDTNPIKEDVAFTHAMREDITWLGFTWAEQKNASDYFGVLYEYAVQLIQAEKAYVDSLDADSIRSYRGTLTEPGRNSPYRDRSVAENLDLFARMRAGEFPDGAHVLRLKIDMASGNMNLRDPSIYRIRHVTHHETGDQWCIYPLYDYTHCISDAIEEITHSLCDTGFEDHRPLYDWVLAQLEVPGRPQQIEFSRLNLQYTVTSKRKLKQLVDENLVEGWNDPRMPTIAGMRRRGYPPEAIRDFCRRIGITKSDNNVELALLESCVREALEPTAPRAMAVLDPVKVVITNLPESETIWLTVQNHPKDPDMGQRSVPFTREIFIDRADFQLQANRKYKRLVLQDEVRLRGGYVIKAESVVMGDQDDILEIHGVYDPETLGVNPPDRKIRGVIHWVSASENMPAVFHRFEPLFSVPFPDAVDEDYRDLINPNSRSVFQGFAEVSLKNQPQDTRFQFEREGYFILDEAAEDEGSVCYNEIVGLRDSWSKGG
ncbi:MAG: glutamine--tRNA ligase/YqeY domain fusion protein [Gammaproteobacteria bacterium]|jgi:glutaminyl-tRNA synthetase|nr:glutamine--tRNA ligase/YqeY domain fusion protein [Gammaproteobacteria bacterium]MCH9819532.1 glutamine--tRNA ligase/YqeY domain fusion protein [Gammaproteobacteria bacterium]MDC1328541.1 glutamine--tRNA ligase/YqeY domain fusion protein [Pseudomonadales bacterium]MDC3328863.1 glutamine--tRNA ligase/YqeY domain fusion protein [Pseudomonadales bacterium]